MAPYADHAPVFDQDLLDSEAFADLRTGFGGCIDEQLVEYRSPRAVGQRVLPACPANRQS